jgi:hypothetical protein
MALTEATLQDKIEIVGDYNSRSSSHSHSHQP